MYGSGICEVYYYPEKYGMKIVATLEKEPEYDFQMVVLWKHLESGRLFFGANSGCSCPAPFEDFFFHGPDDTDLTELVEQTLPDLNAAAGEVSVDSAQRSRFLRTARAALKARQKAIV